MRKIIFFLGIIVITIAFLLIGLQSFNTYAWSQSKVMPGTISIKSQKDAVAVGRTVASFNLAKGATEKQVTLKEAKKLDTTGLKSAIAQDGVEANQIFTQQKDEVWVVVFTGLFTPKHLHFAAGTNPEIPVCTTMEIYLSAKDGSVIGTRIYDQISPPQ
jgi:hypothetical protein